MARYRERGCDAIEAARIDFTGHAMLSRICSDVRMK